MGIFSRLFNRRGGDGSELDESEQPESDARSTEAESAPETPAPSDPPPPRPKAISLDPLDPDDFEVRTKSGRNKRLSAPNVPSDAPPVDESVSPLDIQLPPPPPPPPLSETSLPSLEPEQLFELDPEPPRDSPTPAVPEAIESVPPDSFDLELERGFDASLRRTSRPAPPDGSGPLPDTVTSEADLDQVRDLFHDMAAHYVGQVRDFMLELRRAEAATIWIPLCEPVVQRLRSMCETLRMPEVSRALEDFARSLEQAKSSPTGIVGGAEREGLLGAYDRLITLLPRAFELGDTGREAIIVELLLLQIPGVRHLTLEKLYRAGLNQFDAFHQAAPAELAACAGIELALAEQIVQRFRAYRATVTGVLAEPDPTQETTRLRRFVEELRQQHDEYERASAGWSNEAIADKKRLRRARLETLSHVYVALARLGEVERVARLKKMGVEWQLDELERYLREFSAGAPPV